MIVEMSNVMRFTDHLIAAGAVRAGDGVMVDGIGDLNVAGGISRAGAAYHLRFMPVDRHLAVFEDPVTREQLAVRCSVQPLAWCVAVANAYSMVEQVVVTLEGGPLNFDRVVALFGSTLPGSPELGLGARVEVAAARLASGMLNHGSFGSEVVPHGERAGVLAEALLAAGFGGNPDETVVLSGEERESIPMVLEQVGLTETARLLRS